MFDYIERFYNARRRRSEGVTMQDRSAGRRRVLVADNNADLAEVLGEIISTDAALEFAGYVLTGAAALHKLRTGAADVLILDLSLGDCHGFEVLDRLTADSSPVKVIVHSGHASPELAAQALLKGAAAYLVKDGDTRALLTAVRNA
ncbi:MAG: hypothetical protein PVS2B1_20650 [Candidatus Dormibacteraceae bacterium]